jgi:hypothetical protein
METQAEVSQAMEALHARAACLALRLEEAGDVLVPEACSLLDDIDALRALHLRVIGCTARGLRGPGFYAFFIPAAGLSSPFLHTESETFSIVCELEKVMDLAFILGAAALWGVMVLAGLGLSEA